ncbi:FAD dependent oxidoreductase, partial [Apiospora saccharicola]
MAPALTNVDYAIVGAGVFGASSALHLIRRFPNAQVVLIDSHNAHPAAASSDYNKIVRANYKDIRYMKLALEAMDLWRSDPILKSYYHETGTAYCDDDINVGREILENYKKLGLDGNKEILNASAARNRFPQLRDTVLTDVNEVFWNPEGGWAEANGALAAVVKAAVDEGVRFYEGAVTNLLLDVVGRRCRGVRVANAEGAMDLNARQVVLCTGAHTAKLLADTAPDWGELQVSDRFMAAGAVQCTARYDSVKVGDKLKNMPVLMLSNWHTHGAVLPLLESKLKINCEIPFTNMTFHEGLGKEISIPPPSLSQSIFGQDVPQGLREEAQYVTKSALGNYIEDLDIDSYRMCWDSVSPDQDWVIDAYPHCEGLFIAAAGSFHSWKFLPNLGKYVVQRMQGELEDGLGKKWAWDRPISKGSDMYSPERDVKDI